MRILCDFHHEDAFRSLQLLSKRLGASMFRPFGMEWHYDGPWNQRPGYEGKIGVLVHDWKPYPGITLDEFKDSPTDIVISSHPNNFIGFKKLAKDFGSKFVVRVGNNWNLNSDEWDGIDNLLSASSSPARKGTPNVAHYHPEFEGADLRSKYRNVRSLLSIQNVVDAEASDKLNELADFLPGWDIREHGHGGASGHVDGIHKVQNRINESGFLFHHKITGDGYGFVLHRAIASGLPFIIPFDAYKGMTAFSKAIPNMTAYDTNYPTEKTASRLQRAAECYENRSAFVRKVWEEQCHPDMEWEEKIKPFFEKVLN